MKVKRVIVLLVSAFLLLSCQNAKQVSPPILSPGSYDVAVSVNESTARGTITIRENSDYEILYTDSQSPLSGLKTGMIGNVYRSEYAGITPNETVAPRSAILIRKALRILLSNENSGTLTQDTVNETQVFKKEYSENGLALQALFDTKSASPLKIKIEDQDVTVLLQFIGNGQDLSDIQ